MTGYNLIAVARTSVLALGVALTMLCGLPATAQAACATPAGVAGDIVYNGTVKVFQYCDNTSWVRMNYPGSGSGGCATPALAEGEMAYNGDSRTLQGCAGNVQRTMGPVGGGNKWIQVDAGDQHNCAILSDGSLRCWGYNLFGRVGDNTQTNRPTPVPPSGVGVWKQISGGGESTCGIKSDDTLWCWGRNFNGQLGDNSTTQRLIPTAIDGGGTWKQIAAGNSHSCGIKSDDTLWCWGNNVNGRTGLNTSAGNTLVPVQVSGGGNWKSVSSGGSHTCAIKTDDSLYCWGSNGFGMTGLNTAVGSTLVPTGISGGGIWLSVAAGGNSSCGIKTDNTLHCWGWNANGRTGLNTAAGNTLVPTQINGGGSWKQVAAGSGHNCAIKSDDSLWCWGGNSSGQLGDGTTTDRLIPTAIGGLSWKQISAGNASCGITSNNAIQCWGANYRGTLGNSTSATQTVPVPVYGTSTWKQTAPGSDFTCGIQSDDSLWCWGYNDYGQVGDGSSLNNRYIPVTISGGGTWKQVTTHYGHSCAIKSDDTAWCWGRNSNGELGDNTSGTNRLIPTAINGGGAWKKISTGGSHSCGIKSDDTLFCWGNNANGRTGLNISAGNTLAPTQINGGGSWKQVAAGWDHTCAIKSDDTLWCWGNNANGQLGDNSVTQRLVPTQENSTSTWTQIAAGFSGTCGIKSDGGLWCWGYNATGQLGDNSTTQRNIPTAVSGGGTWKKIDTDNSSNYWAPHSCGIKSDDSLWCWGAGSSGQLGQGTTSSSLVPLAVTGGGAWVDVGTHDGVTCGILKGGEMRCWGYNGNGQITATEFSSPISQVAIQTWCSSPAGKAGTIVYNSDFNVLQYCDGAGWVKVRR